MNSRDFYIECLRFSWWTVEISMMDGRNFHDSRSRFSRWISRFSIENDSSTPIETNYLRDATILVIDFEDQYILKIIRALDINKTHGHDHISKCIIKIYDSSIVKLLSTIFRNSLNSGIFPDNRKRWKIVPVHRNTKKERSS